jgi:molecular chaperone GrpE
MPMSEEENDDIVEFEYNEDGEEDLKKTLKKLRGDLKQVKKEKEEYLTGWQKERADFANFKKDEDARKKAFAEFQLEGVLSRFLSVMDSFGMAMANKEAWEKVDKNWRIGVEHIHSELKKIFEEHGVVEIGTVGESFDPNIHHSIASVCGPDQTKDHTVTEVVQKGYKLGNRVLRPAQVKVYEYQDGE